MQLKDKIKTGLDEGRMLVLVAQVLIGFDLRAVFEPMFAELSPVARWTKAAALGLQILVLMLLLSIPSFHRIAERGESTPRFDRYLSVIMRWALLPFALSLGGDSGVALSATLTGAAAIGFGAGATALAFFFWYGIEWWERRCKPEKNMESPREEKTPLKDKIQQVLTEGRVILPGAQALLGFQFATILTEPFKSLPRFLQLWHLGSLSLITLSAILLMTPPAYHRLVEQGENSEDFHKLAGRFVLASMLPLALGISIDLFVVLEKISGSLGLSLCLAVLASMLFALFWFIYPSICRHRTGQAHKA